MTSIHLAAEYVVVNCGPESSGGCNLSFAMTRQFYDETRRTGRGWCCPAGHKRIVGGQTTEDKLQNAEAREIAVRDQLRAAEVEAENLRVAQMRERHRVANGVCPCCNRSFENLRRHMAGQHPDFDPGKEAIAKPFKCSCHATFETIRGLRTHQGHMRRDDWWKPSKGNYWRHLTVLTDA